VTGCVASPGSPTPPPPPPPSSGPPPPPPTLCDDKEAKTLCQEESRVEPGVKSTECFNAAFPHFPEFPDCNPMTWLAENARFQEFVAQGESGDVSAVAEMSELARETLPPACKTALRCFGSSSAGAKQIVLTVTLPFASKEAFTEDLQLRFRTAIARVAGVPVESVVIVTIILNRRRDDKVGSIASEASDGLWHTRAQHGGGLNVQTAVTTPSDRSVLSANNINSELTSQGLPAITSLSVGPAGED
jgi:hypothetical protein